VRTFRKPGQENQSVILVGVLRRERAENWWSSSWKLSSKRRRRWNVQRNPLAWAGVNVALCVGPFPRRLFLSQRPEKRQQKRKKKGYGLEGPNHQTIRWASGESRCYDCSFRRGRRERRSQKGKLAFASTAVKHNK